jgi:arylsulfatase A-like enzyme
MRFREALSLAVWSAVVFGLLEGIVLCVCRAYPAILASRKVPVEVLWIAPLLDIPFFLGAAVALFVAVRLASRVRQVSEPALVFGGLLWLGYLVVLSTPIIIHIVSATLLSLGLAIATWRLIAGRYDRISTALVRWLPVAPVLLILVAGSIAGYQTVRESTAAGALPAARSGDPNVLVIVLDTVRYDRFARNPETSITPNLDRIAAGGLRYENAWSTSSWSLPTQVSILTGRYPTEHGAAWPSFELKPTVPTLGEYFGSRGYVTGAFSANPAWVTPEYLGRGFLRFNVYTAEDVIRRTTIGRKLDRVLRAVMYADAGRAKPAAEVNAQFLEALNDYPGRPFFAYLCYMDANAAVYDRKFNTYFRRKAPMAEVSDSYDAGLRRLDASIGDLFADLSRRGILDNTIVVITSDHGESFPGVGDDHKEEGHGSSLYPEQVRVPLFVVAPGRVPAGGKVDDIVTTKSIAATLMNMLGETNGLFPGQPLPLPAGSGPSDRRDSEGALAFLRYGGLNMDSAARDRLYYIVSRDEAQAREEIYDLTQDPTARNPLQLPDSILRPYRDMLDSALGMSDRESGIGE